MSQSTAKWFAHLSGLLGQFLGVFGFLGPLIMYLVYRDKDVVVTENAKQALNFQLSFMIYSFIGGLTTIVLVGFLIIPVVWIATIVFPVIATVKTSNGESNYYYPLTLPLLR